METIDEIIEFERRSLEYNVPDDDLIAAIDNAIVEARPLKELMDAIGKRNEIYWQKGTDLDDTKLHPKKSRIIDNRIFMSVETIIPMVTARTPEPTILGDITNDLREKLVTVLNVFYEVKGKIKNKLQRVLRHWFIYRLGVLKYRWDNGFIIETVKVSKIGIDPSATSRDDCEFWYEQLEDSLENIIDKFPKKKKELKTLFPDTPKRKIKYLEFWGGKGEWVAWKLRNILLDKQKNPNFNYGTKEKGVEGEEDYAPEAEGKNLFKTPQFPYLPLKVFGLGDTLYDDTSLIEQAITLQDGVTQRKRQIADLVEKAKRLIVGSSNAISQEQLQKFVNKYGDIALWLDRGNINDIKVEGGQADASLFNELAHTISEIDNIMGTHSTTRGERAEQETLGGRQLLQGADYGRTETIVEAMEQLLEDLYNAYLQMIMVYGLEDNTFSNGEQTVTLTQEEIPAGVMVMVKKGSSLPVDKAGRAEMAMKLAQFNFIDPITLFEELGYGKEEERTKRLYEWLAMSGKINPQYVAGMGASAGGEQQKVQQLAKLKQMMESPEFQQLPPEEQQPMVQQAKQIVQQIKSGGTTPTG